MKNTTISILTLFVGLNFLACDTGETPESSCVPGQEVACTCEDGAAGSQTCAEDGSAFNECICEEPLASGCMLGELDVCACDEDSFGMRECGEDEVFGECLCESGTGGGNDIPHTQWVLRDKDGEVVNAVFEPVCSGDSKQSCFEQADEKDYPCMNIKYLNSAPVWAVYETETGNALKCYKDYENWSFVNSQIQIIYYTNSNCTGAKYVSQPFGNSPHSPLVRVGSQLFEATYNNKVELNTVFYDNTEECVEEDSSNLSFIEIKEADSASLMENGAPYLMRLE